MSSKVPSSREVLEALARMAQAGLPELKRRLITSLAERRNEKPSGSSVLDLAEFLYKSDWQPNDALLISRLRDNTRRLVADTRKWLEEYYRSAGIGESIMWQIVRGSDHYELAWTSRSPVQGPWFEELWKTYVAESPRHPIQIVVNEFLCFRYQRRFFYRDAQVNFSGDSDTSFLEGLLGKEIVAQSDRVGVYMSAGDMRAALELQAFLRRAGGSESAHVDVRVKGSEESLNEFRDYNLVLIGSARANDWIRQYQTEWPYRVTATDVARGSGTNEVTIRDEQGPPGVYFAHGVVTRFKRPNGTHVTIIAINHSRAACGVVQLVIDANQFRAIQTKFQEIGARQLPEAFQVLVRVPILTRSKEMEVGDPSVVEVYFPDP